MKEKGFSHLDIKCDNILLDDKLDVKIGDFGLAQQNSEGIEQQIFSEDYSAPEIYLKKMPYDGEKADIFSLGVTLFAL